MRRTESPSPSARSVQSEQLQMDAVSGLVAIGAVIADDVDDLIEQRWTFATLRADNLGLDSRTVRRVAGEEKSLSPSDHRLVAEHGPGPLIVIDP